MYFAFIYKRIFLKRTLLFARSRRCIHVTRLSPSITASHEIFRHRHGRGLPELLVGRRPASDGRPVPSPSSNTMDSEEERRKQKKREKGNAAVRRTREKQAREAREKAEKMERLPRENQALEANIEGFQQVRWSWNPSSQEFHQP